MGTITRSFANNITSGGTFDATDLTGTIPASNIADASVTNITAVPSLTAVSTVASDPPSPDAGQIWYNTTARALRAYIAGAGSWATGGALNTARIYASGAGTRDASLAAGGETPSPAIVGNTELYDGTSWTEVNDLNTARSAGGSGGATNTAAIYWGGTSPAVVANVETWNGTSWTEVNDLNTARRSMPGGGGTSTSTLAFGGESPGAAQLAVTESWNGTSWTEVNNLNTARQALGASGISNGMVVYGGYTTGRVSNTELWD